MACEILGIDGTVMYVKISGIMKLADQQSIQAAGMGLIKQGGKARLFVTLDNFQGWDKGDDWGDVGFMIAHGNDLSKIAVVGDAKWEDQVCAFLGKGLRSTEIEFFPASSLKEAESWIQA